MAKSEHPTTIKKYANRRLYNTGTSTYVTLEDLAAGPMDRKAFLRAALETGRMEFLQGRLDAAEAISRTTLENALAWLVEQEMVVERDRKLVLGPRADRPEQREAFRDELRAYLGA